MDDEKELNKQEIIDLFINRFNEHRELFPGISEEMAKDIFNTSIKHIEYIQQNGLVLGGWMPDIGKIQIVNGKGAIHRILHELIHLLSTSKDDIKAIGKVGLSIYFDKSEKEVGTGITEGITDAIAEILSGEKNTGYQVEKNAAYMLFSLIGTNNVLERYFDNHFLEKNTNIGEDFKFSDLFSEDILQKYGDIKRQEQVRNLIDRMSDIVDNITELNSTKMQRN